MRRTLPSCTTVQGTWGHLENISIKSFGDRERFLASQCGLEMLLAGGSGDAQHLTNETNQPPANPVDRPVLLKV
jgi:hypothetical protein